MQRGLWCDWHNYHVGPENGRLCQQEILSIDRLTKQFNRWTLLSAGVCVCVFTDRSCVQWDSKVCRFSKHNIYYTMKTSDFRSLVWIIIWQGKIWRGEQPSYIKAIIHNPLAFISLHYPYPSISPHIPPYSSSFHVERTRDLTPFRERQLKAMTTLPSVDKATKRCKKPSKKENGSMNAVDCCKNMYPRQWKRTNICTSLGQGKENKTSLEEQMENYWL